MFAYVVKSGGFVAQQEDKLRFFINVCICVYLCLFARLWHQPVCMCFLCQHCYAE